MKHAICRDGERTEAWLPGGGSGGQSERGRGEGLGGVAESVEEDGTIRDIIGGVINS